MYVEESGKLVQPIPKSTGLYVWALLGNGTFFLAAYEDETTLGSRSVMMLMGFAFMLIGVLWHIVKGRQIEPSDGSDAVADAFLFCTMALYTLLNGLFLGTSLGLSYLHGYFPYTMLHVGAIFVRNLALVQFALFGVTGMVYLFADTGILPVKNGARFVRGVSIFDFIYLLLLAVLRSACQGQITGEDGALLGLSAAMVAGVVWAASKRAAVGSIYGETG